MTNTVAGFASTDSEGNKDLLLQTGAGFNLKYTRVRAMSRAVTIPLHLMGLTLSQDRTQAESFLIYVLEYTVHTVPLDWGRKEAPALACETVWTNIHPCCGYTNLYTSNHLSTDVYLQMVRVRRVCARLLILFAFASLSVYTSLTAVGILRIRPVSQRSVTYGSFPWRNQFVLSQSHGQLQQASGGRLL